MMREDKVTDLKDHVICKSIKEALPELEESSIMNAIQEAKERNTLYDICERRTEKELLEVHGIKSSQCYNGVCEHCSSEGCSDKSLRACGCMYRMIDPPPNSLDYNEYMPSHHEALDRLEKNGLLKGDHEDYVKDAPDYGKAATQADRANHVINGVTMIQLEEALKFCFKRYSDYWESEDGKALLANEVDLDVVFRNALIEVEKILGIYPNIKLR
jgi:hypothetical protein